jgi:serine/threonine-protein kinase
VIVLALAALANNLADQTPSNAPSTTPTKTPSRSPSPSPSRSESSKPASPSASQTTDDRVTVDPALYQGRPKDEVAKELKALGLKVDETKVENPGDQESDTVADVTPSGKVEPGSTVTMAVYGDPPDGASNGNGNGNGNENGKGNGD